MKNSGISKYNKLQKVMIIIVPVIVLLLLVSIVMCAAFSILPMPVKAVVSTGNLTIILAGCSTVLAVLGLVFTVFTKSGDNDEE